MKNNIPFHKLMSLLANLIILFCTNINKNVFFRLKKKHKHHRKQFAKSISMTENRLVSRTFRY